MKTSACLALTFLFLGLGVTRARAESPRATSSILDRDRTYEEDLRWEASDDKTITPARFFRWVSGMRGAAVFATTTPAEFQPIVNVHDSQVRAVATIAIKF